MKKRYITGLMGLCLFALLGCRSMTNENFFRLGVSDEAISAAVNTAFINYQDLDLATQKIHVETHKGTVILSGYVKTIRQSDTAGEIAGKVAGVKSVQNNLIVRK